MDNDDNRDYAEEAYNRAEMEREAREEYEAEEMALIRAFVDKWNEARDPEMFLDLTELVEKVKENIQRPTT